VNRRPEIARQGTAGTIFRHLEQTRRHYATIVVPAAQIVASSTRPSRNAVPSVITITGTGDHLRLDQPITFAGMRKSASVGGAAGS
jgi:hypothetical protein